MVDDYLWHTEYLEIHCESKPYNQIKLVTSTNIYLQFSISVYLSQHVTTEHAKPNCLLPMQTFNPHMWT